MSEKKIVNNEGNETVETTPAEKKPVAKAKVKEEPKKEGWFTRNIVNPVKRNKKAIIAGIGGLGAGIAGTVAYGYFSNKAAEKKRQEREQVYITQEETNPLDPNV